MSRLKVNDTVVYPGHGVGLVTRIESKEIFGKTQDMVTVQMVSSGMKIMFPIESVKQLGVRKTLSAPEISKILRQVKALKVERNNNWNLRYRLYMEKVKSGDFKEICEALHALWHSAGEFELSFGERKMIDTCVEQLTDELMIGCKASREDARISLEENLK